MLYQLSYLGTVCGKKSEALIQDHPIKIKLPGHPRSEIAPEQAVAEREGFEPSVEVSPYGSLANCCLRPLGHLSTGLSSMRGSQSSATQVDDCWKTSKGAVILPQAMWEVQAIRTVDEEKLSGGDRNSSQV